MRKFSLLADHQLLIEGLFDFFEALLSCVRISCQMSIFDYCFVNSKVSALDQRAQPVSMNFDDLYHSTDVAEQTHLFLVFKIRFWMNQRVF